VAAFRACDNGFFAALLVGERPPACRNTKVKSGSRVPFSCNAGTIENVLVLVIVLLNVLVGLGTCGYVLVMLLLAPPGRPGRRGDITMHAMVDFLAVKELDCRCRSHWKCGGLSCALQLSCKACGAGAAGCSS